MLIRPHCPWQNGKVERFNRTLQTEWAYRQVFTTNAERTAALAPWLEHLVRHRGAGPTGAVRPKGSCIATEMYAVRHWWLWRRMDPMLTDGRTER